MWAAAVLCLASCSSAPGGPPAVAVSALSPPVTATVTPSASSPPEATPRPVGAIDANPADPPIEISTLVDVARRAPAHVLPTGWNTAAWFAQVQAAGGPRVTKHVVKLGAAAPGESQRGWDWSGGGVRILGVGIQLDPQNNPVVLDCFTQGFDPASRRAVAKIASVFALCTSATFPGAHLVAARRWVDKQEALMVADMRASPHVAQILSSTPSFGPAVYWLESNYKPGFGITFQLKVL
jgi:hypothetical protein